MTIRYYRILIFLAAMTFVGCSSNAPNESTNVVRLQLNWRADAQHGGFYAAQILGEYESEGLHVEILQGGPGTPVVPKLAMGRVEFAIVNADQILQAREQEADIVGVMSPMQHSPRCIMVHSESGIERLEELSNLTLAMNEGRTFAIFLKSRVELENVRIVPYSGSIAKFLIDKNYAQQAYVFSEPLVARRQGGDPKCLMVSQLGFDPYTSVVAVRRETLEEAPELVRRFVAATIRGWQKYLQSPDETNREIHRVNPDMDTDSLRVAAEAIRPLCLPEGFKVESLGRMSAERWVGLAEQMKSIDAIASPPAAAANAAWEDLPCWP